MPAFLRLRVLLVLQRIDLNPRDLEAGVLEIKGEALPGLFWVYLDALGQIEAGCGDFPVISSDFHGSAIAFDSPVPLFYSRAVGIDAIAALIFERQVRSHQHLNPDVCIDCCFTVCSIGIVRKRAEGIAKNDFIGYRYGSRGIDFESRRSWTRA
ncbi:hypothetical protein QUA81_04020 [Microcoleus sp. F6_B4]